MLGVPGQYKNAALMLGYKLDFSCYANKDGFCRDSHILVIIILYAVVLQKPLYICIPSLVMLILSGL